MNLHWFKIKNRTMTIILAAAVVLIVNSIAGAQLVTDDSSATSITLNWTAPGDDGNSGTAAEYDLRYSTSTITESNWGSAVQVNDEPLPSAAGTAEAHTVTGLQSATTYYFAIKTMDDAGNISNLSNVLAKTTGSETETEPPSNISTLATSNPTVSTITLSWTAPGDDGEQGTATQYDIRYSTSTITDDNWSSATQVSGEPSPQIAGSEESFVVEGLQASTTYYFAIKTADEIPNWSGLSNVVSGTTAETGEDDTAPGRVTDFIVTAMTETSATLTWTAPGDDEYDGQATVYDIRYNTVSIDNWNWGQCTSVSNETAPQVAGSEETITITGLSEGITYYFALRTYDEVPNYSLLSNIASNTTENEEVAPSAISSLQISEANEDNVVLTWIAPGDDADEGQASQYDIRYSLTAITSENWDNAVQVSDEPSPSAAGAEETYTVEGLDGEVRYYFAIKTADEVPNWSDLSNVVSIITPDQTPPATISDLNAVTGEDIGSVSIEWTAPGDDDDEGIAESYVIKVHSEPLDENNWNQGSTISDLPTPLESGSLQSFQISNLNPGEYYYVAMTSEDDYGNISEISNVGSAEAKPFGTDGIDDASGLPKYYDLSQNYPNPFNPTTNMDFALPEPSHVRLDVYDSNGRLVTNLADRYYEAGYHTIVWNGRSSNGGEVATGVYFYRLTTSEFQTTKKMIFLK